MEESDFKNRLFKKVISQSKEFDSELSDFEETGIPYPRGAHLSDNEFSPRDNNNLIKSQRNFAIIDTKRKPSNAAARMPISEDLLDQLENFYDCRVRPGLARKQRCEDIAYAVTHKVLRKVQTVDDRFRGSNLVPHGIPYDGLRGGESILIEMILTLPLGPKDTLLVKRDDESTLIRIQPMSDVLWQDCITKGGFISASKVQALLRKYVKQAVHVLRKYISQSKTEKYPKALKSLFIGEATGIALIINRDIHVRVLPAFSIPDSRNDFTRRDCPSSSHVVCCQKTVCPADISHSTASTDGGIKRSKFGWGVSFYVAEKNKMRALANGCRIQLLRILTELRDNEEALKSISSYHLKTLLFYLCDEQPDVDDWDQQHLAERFLDIMKRLRKCLLTASLSHYFMRLPEFPPFNLFEGIPNDELQRMAEFVEKLAEEPQPYLSNERGKVRDGFWPWETEFDPSIIE